MKLLYDVENSRWYNENGESFGSDNPSIPYGNAERVEIQLYSEVKGANSGSSAVADWTKYTGFTGNGYGSEGWAHAVWQSRYLPGRDSSTERIFRIPAVTAGFRSVKGVMEISSIRILSVISCHRPFILF